MVNIDPDKVIPGITELKQTKHRIETLKNEGAFDAIFRQAIDSKETKCNDTESTPFISEIRPAQFASESAQSTDMIVDQVQQLIGTMEVYQQKLANDRETLKDIQPLMDEMTVYSKNLAAVSKAGEMEDELKTIVDQSLMLSSIEISRYNNGLYNN